MLLELRWNVRQLLQPKVLKELAPGDEAIRSKLIELPLAVLLDLVTLGWCLFLGIAFLILAQLLVVVRA